MNWKSATSKVFGISTEGRKPFIDKHMDDAD